MDFRGRPSEPGAAAVIDNQTSLALRFRQGPSGQQPPPPPPPCSISKKKEEKTLEKPSEPIAAYSISIQPKRNEGGKKLLKDARTKTFAFARPLFSFHVMGDRFIQQPGARDQLSTV